MMIRNLDNQKNQKKQNLDPDHQVVQDQILRKRRKRKEKMIIISTDKQIILKIGKETNKDRETDRDNDKDKDSVKEKNKNKDKDRNNETATQIENKLKMDILIK